jgi:hypothetical protein
MRTLNDYFLTAKVTDISTAGSTFVAVPDVGNIVKIYTSVLKMQLHTADAAITFEIGGTAVTNGAITVTQAGSAAGDVDSSTPSAANRVEEGGSIEIISDGASATACEMIVTFVIRR